MLILVDSLYRFADSLRMTRRRRFLAPKEAALEQQIADAFTQQGERFLHHFSTLRSHFRGAALPYEDDFDAAWDDTAAETLSAFEQPLSDMAEAMLAAGIRHALGDFGTGVSFDVANPRAVAYLQQHGADLVSGINQTTRDGLRRILTQAAQEGWSYSRTAAEIKQQFDGFAGRSPLGHIRNRAELIAVHEVGMAYGSGQNLVAHDLERHGLRMQKRVITAADPCPVCESDEGEGWIPLDDTFSSGANHPPEEHPGCRCDCAYERVGAGEVS
jgi:hypothetical protein